VGEKKRAILPLSRCPRKDRGVEGGGTDITERKKANTKLNSSSKSYLVLKKRNDPKKKEGGDLMKGKKIYDPVLKKVNDWGAESKTALKLSIYAAVDFENQQKGLKAM